MGDVAGSHHLGSRPSLPLLASPLSLTLPRPSCAPLFGPQRSRTAREAIATMDALVQAHGYASDGESFSIADGDEVWLLEMIGKGVYGVGAVWVAVRVPDGMIGSTANQARIRTFPRDDPDNCRYSPDVVAFARRVGLYPPSAPDEAFSFSDVYDPVTFSGARHGEARVWAIFQHATGGALAAYESCAPPLRCRSGMASCTAWRLQQPHLCARLRLPWLRRRAWGQPDESHAAIRNTSAQAKRQRYHAADALACRGDLALPWR